MRHGRHAECSAKPLRRCLNVHCIAFDCLRRFCVRCYRKSVVG
jgi:hypothetical protein